MVARRKVIDIDERSDIHRILEELRVDRSTVVLRESGEEIALLQALPPTDFDAPGGGLSDAEVEEFRTTAGGWRGIVDIEQFLNDNEESRLRSTRPSVEW
jgi:hypothetical protein